jgi:hypothetical protein
MPNVGDIFLREIIKDSNFIKNPIIITSTEMEKLEKQKTNNILYRGITKSEYSNIFKNGEYYAGTGICGSGIYTSNDMKVAKQYAGNTGIIMKMCLNKDAKIINGDDLRIIQEKFLDELNEYKQNIQKYSDEYKKVELIRHIMEDPGKFATINGYDAIKYSGDGILVKNQMLVLNRSVLFVQDTDIN